MKNFYIKVPWKYLLEKDFNTAYLKVWKETHKNWGYKISDMARVQKPTDTILADETGVYIAEFKMIKSNVLDIWQFEPWQMKAWRTVSWLCWRAIAIVYSIKFNRYKVLDFKDIIEKKDKWEMEIRLLF